MCTLQGLTPHVQYPVTVQSPWAMQPTHQGTWQDVHSCWHNSTLGWTRCTGQHQAGITVAELGHGQLHGSPAAGWRGYVPEARRRAGLVSSLIEPDTVVQYPATQHTSQGYYYSIT